MKIKHEARLLKAMEKLLEEFDEDGGNPGLCYDWLADDMAKAAAAVYDACMRGQEYADQER